MSNVIEIIAAPCTYSTTAGVKFVTVAIPYTAIYNERLENAKLADVVSAVSRALNNATGHDAQIYVRCRQGRKPAGFDKLIGQMRADGQLSLTKEAKPGTYAQVRS